MRFDFIGIALAGLYAVGVYGALCKKSLLGLFSYLIPEHLVKFRAYDFSLLLRVGYSFKSIYKMVLTVYAHEIHIEQRSECLFDEIALVLTHKPLVNKNAGELFADGAREKSRRDRGIDTARKAENNLFVSDFFAKALYGIVNKAVHLPVAVTAANIIQKIVKNFKSELRVSYLGVELHAVYFLFFVFISCYRAGFRFCGYFKT